MQRRRKLGAIIGDDQELARAHAAKVPGMGGRCK